MNIKEFKFRNIVKDDYPELEGKVVTYYSGLHTYQGVVVGCNRSVGVTIVNLEDKDDYLLCITGAVSPGGYNMPDSAIKSYDEYFSHIIEKINEGHLDAFELVKFRDGCEYVSIRGVVKGGSCPYGQ